MKELKISRLMDDYVDNEVCIEGETSVDNEELKGLVMKQVKKPPLIRPAFKAAIAALAAAVGIGAMFGFTPEQHSITTLSNYTVSYKVMDYDDIPPNTAGRYYDEEGVFYYDQKDSNIDHLVRLEQGRIIFTGDGQHIDVTDLIDEETPYIYPYKNAGDGSQGYIVIGGTPDFFAFADIYYLRDSYEWFGVRFIVEDMAVYPENADYEKDSEDIHLLERKILWDRLYEYADSGRLIPGRMGFDRWLYNAGKELGLDIYDLYGGTQELIYFYDAEKDESLFHTPYRQEIRY